MKKRILVKKGDDLLSSRNRKGEMPKDSTRVNHLEKKNDNNYITNPSLIPSNINFIRP